MERFRLEQTEEEREARNFKAMIRKRELRLQQSDAERKFIKIKEKHQKGTQESIGQGKKSCWKTLKLKEVCSY